MVQNMSMTEIQLTQGKIARVDDEDAAILNRYSWFAQSGQWKKYYAGAKIRGKLVLMHVFLMKPPSGVEIDHRDGDGLNNQRRNLRICLHIDNTRNQKIRSTNRSGFKGVYFHKKSKKWAASIFAGKTFHLGLFDDKDSAAKTYDDAAERMHGEFALTNKKLGLLN